jgi:FkbM family methyltransferase
MPTLRQSMVAGLVRSYPLFSGCGTLANHGLVRALAGSSSERAWARVAGGEVLAPLDDYVGRAAFYAGDLDRKITWICARIVRPGDTALDVGANIGLTTLALAARVGPTGRVHAFEPNPELVVLLERSLRHNRVTNARLHAVALGAAAGRLDLHVPPRNAGEGSLARNREVPGCRRVSVPVRTLTEVMEEEGIGAVRLVKIDVEGFELQVLQGALPILAARPPAAILFELNERTAPEIRDEPVIRLLDDHGYGFFDVPRGLLRVRVARLDPRRSNTLRGHDLIASPRGARYEEIAAALGASS